MQLHFLNEFPFLNGWPSWLGWLTTSALTTAAFWISYRSIADGPARWYCASLRACAVFFIAITLLEPTLQREERAGKPGRVHFLVDLSSSMEWTDQLALQAGKLNRRERLSKHLLSPQSGLLEQLTDRFDCRVHTIQVDGSLREIQHRHAKSNAMQSGQRGGQNLLGATTELSPLRVALERQLELLKGNESQSGACIVLLSDGQSTDSAALSSLASSFDLARLPVFTVGYGPRSDISDLGLTNGTMSIQSYVDGLVTGELNVMETIPAGTAYTIQAISGTQTIWEQKFTASSRDRRDIPFSFSAQKLVNAVSVEQTPKNSTSTEIVSGLPVRAIKLETTMNSP